MTAMSVSNPKRPHVRRLAKWLALTFVIALVVVTVYVARCPGGEAPELTGRCACWSHPDRQYDYPCLLVVCRIKCWWSLVTTTSGPDADGPWRSAVSQPTSKRTRSIDCPPGP